MRSSVRAWCSPTFSSSFSIRWIYIDIWWIFFRVRVRIWLEGVIFYILPPFCHGLRLFSLKDGMQYSPPQLHKEIFCVLFAWTAYREGPRVPVWCGLHIISALLLCLDPYRVRVHVCAVRMEPMELQSMCGGNWFHRKLGFDTLWRSLCWYAYIFATKIISLKKKKMFYNKVFRGFNIW